jgi:hypothetical protein
VTDPERLLYLNGLDATTGHSLIDPVSYDALVRRVLDIYAPKQRREDKETYRRERFAPFAEYRLDDPSQVGWGLLVHADDAEVMEEYLSALIEHRHGRVLLYRGEPVREWKEKHHADAINPDRFPYYVLIAGSPTRVPYELQFSLNVLHAVGRIELDGLDDYAHYAQTVVDQEMGQTPPPSKQIVLFAPRHPGDYATGQSSQRLVHPILQGLRQGVSPDLTFNALMEEEATKANLLAALAADETGRTPALVFSAGHGAALQADQPHQRMLQGSIVCQDYRSPLTPQHRHGFISGYDVAEGFQLAGGISFLFACYGAGSRANSDFVHYVPTKTERERLRAVQGAEDFVAYLPKALLSNPQGGALAVVGHVDPAWVHSFTSPVTKERRVHPFGFALARLLRGVPVGYAMTAFSQKYADLSIDLLNLIEGMEETNQLPNPAELSDLWICRNDAQNYVIVGDPAVRLRFG